MSCSFRYVKIKFDAMKDEGYIALLVEFGSIWVEIIGFIVLRLQAMQYFSTLLAMVFVLHLNLTYGSLNICGIGINGDGC